MSENKINEDKNCCGGDCDCNDTATPNHNHGQECGCGSNHDHNHEHHDHPDVITLTLENDENVECSVLGIFDVEDQEYIALLPEEGDDVFIYIYSESETGEVALENIESQEDFDKVSAVFLEIIENENEEDTSSEE